MPFFSVGYEFFHPVPRFASPFVLQKVSLPFSLEACVNLFGTDLQSLVGPIPKKFLRSSGSRPLSKSSLM